MNGYIQAMEKIRHSLLIGFLGFSHSFSMPGFEFHEIVAPEKWNRESLLPADIDKDGDTDFFMGEGRGSRSFWFENRGKEGWVDHLVSDSVDSDVGAVALDIDGDGWVDKAAGGYWYRNTGHPRESVFTACKDSAAEYVHDMLAGDIDGDGVQDIINIDYDGIRWYTVPRDSRCLPWIPHQVNGMTLIPQQHGGIAIGDIDGDGDLDISRVDRWFENAEGKGLVWVEHFNLDFGREGGWGLSGKASILDMDGDGAMDILGMECDLPNGRVAWFKNLDKKGKAWERHLIKDSTDGQDFHTLALADYDGDGDQDIFSIGGPSTVGTPKAFLWENRDGKGKEWKEQILFEGRQGHEGAVLDIDGDGDQDILVKRFGTGPMFYFENLLHPSSSVIPFSIRRGATPTGSNMNNPNLLRWGWRTPLLGRTFNAKGRVQ